MQLETHSTFVFSSKDFSASPQMSHREEVLRKMTPQIRTTTSLHMVPDTLPPTVAFTDLVWEKGSLFIPKSFRIKPVSFHYFSPLGEEKPLSLGALSPAEPLPRRETSFWRPARGRGHASYLQVKPPGLAEAAV